MEPIQNDSGLDLSFGKVMLPAVGPHLYWEVGGTILQKGLKVLTGKHVPEFLNFLYSSQNQTNDQISKFKETLETKAGVYVFNKNIWTPSGLYVVNDNEVDSSRLVTEGVSNNVKVFDLMKKIEEGTEIGYGVRESTDGSVRFAPKGSYVVGEVDPEQLSDDGFVIANYGLEGALMISKVASLLPQRPILSSMDLDEEFWGYHSPLDSKDKIASICTYDGRLELCGIRSDGSDGRGDMKSYSYGIKA